MKALLVPVLVRGPASLGARARLALPAMRTTKAWPSTAFPLEVSTYSPLGVEVLAPLLVLLEVLYLMLVRDPAGQCALAQLVLPVLLALLLAPVMMLELLSLLPWGLGTWPLSLLLLAVLATLLVLVFEQVSLPKAWLL